MKKKIITAILCLSMIGSINLVAQTESFDIATYTPPKDFKKDSKDGVISYSHVNTASGRFCVINIYASSVSSGDEQKDFKNEWNLLVATPFKTTTIPQTETTEADGWKAVVGASLVKLDEAEMYIILTVFSGFGKIFTIRTSLNEASYTKQLDGLLETMKLDKTAKPMANNNNTAPAQTSSGKGKFGNMTYNPPANWSEQQFPDGVLFKPADLPSGDFLMMQVMTPLNSSGSLEQALAQSYDEAAAMYKSKKMHAAGGAEFEKKDARRSFKGWEYIRGSGGVMIENGTPYPSEYGLDLFVIKVNNRFERIATLKTRRNCQGSMSRYYPDERPAYRNAIENFLFSIQFADLPSPDLKPGTINGDGIIGVWEGISMRAGTATSSNPAGLSYEVFTPIFLTNGQVYFGTRFPTEGLENLNSWIRAENTRRDWGTYSFSNGRGVLKLPYGELPMRSEGNKFIIRVNNTDHAFRKLSSVDGARFDGTYVMSESYGKIPEITFTADGGFTDKGAIKALYHESDDCTNPGLAPGSGTYEVKNHSVIFSFSDGRKISVAFTGIDYDMKNHSPVSFTMGFNEDALRRKIK